MPQQLPADSSDAEKDQTSSTRFRHLTQDDLLLVRSYEPDFMAEVDRAMLAKRPVYLQLDGYESNRDIIAACLWYALDHGVKVTVTTSAIEANVATVGAANASTAKWNTK